MPTLSKPAPEIFPGVVDAVPDALVVVDAAGAIRFVNARAEHLFGCPRSALVGRPACEVVPGIDVAAAQLLAGSETGARLELTAVRAPADLPVLVLLTRMTQCGEDLVAVTIRDDSERRSLESACVRLREELFATVSHELRTPLTSIIGYTEVLVDMGDQVISEQAARLLSIIERNAARQLGLVEDLLTLAALGAAGLPVESTPTDLVPIVAEVLHGLAVHATEAGVQLRYVSPDEVWIHGDAVRLGQAVRNLVGNAIKFTPAGGQVVVAVSTTGALASLLVEDQGVGVAAEDLPRIFEGLYRGSHAVDAHLPGAGLGLPIVKGIVDAHGGRIDIESDHGEGTRVLVHLPLAHRPAEVV